ncbi:transcription factor/nuclear export subunit protein 2-domain-containing protein [Crassisporium funariophilum]|nr:transcription factor/nuclear export subunit protein 2-domain-containing protein [Crassisporium funariophilum]
MDVVSSVRDCLKTWGKGGDSECRNILIAPHCNPTSPDCLDVLTTAYHTILCASLVTWSPPHALTPIAFVEFLQSVLINLPSSSNTTSKVPLHVSIFGDHLVDMIWSIDTELDELLIEARAASTALADQAPSSAKDVGSLVSKAKKVQANVESDKQRLQTIVKKLLECGILNPDHCRERLDSAVLASVGLIPDKASLEKKEIRTRTGLFYKQNKFNLLREQSEGYSKLTVELTSSLGPPHSPSTGCPTESNAVIEDRARPVWEKIISLIGYFDLDPNRALDVILDVLSQHLTTHYSFFLALLSFSPWSGSYRRSRPEDGVASMKVDIPAGSYKGKSLEEVLALAESNSVSNFPSTNASGARVLAQVLGFKFNYYQTPDLCDAVPRNLYLTAAVLIRAGFITLEDLYPHLSPHDEDMDNGRKEYIANVQSRIAGAKNSMLAMAAPLESGQPSSQSKAKAPASVEVKKPELKDSNQKVGLLTALLAVGAIKPAIAIMSKFPWLVDAHTEIADLMIRIMKVSISPLYESVLITKERNPSFTHPRARYGSSGVAYPSPRKPVLTLWAPTPPSTSTNDFVFFLSDWADRIPISSSVDDLEDVIEPLLRFIGLHVSRDPLFLTKFLRLGRLHLQSTLPIDPVTKKPAGEPDPEHPTRLFWFKILRMYLLPALPLIRGNAVCTVEVWNIIRQYETTARWRLYGEWKTTTYKSHPELRIREVQADRESKGILRRLSHQTIDSLSGTVAKLAHSNPCILFSNAVNQIMAYDNLASVVIQALRYVTNMGFDVLVFIILGALANPDKERVKDDGVNTSDWLQSLASFTGMLFRRYSADLTPVLKYIVHQLHNGQTTEIIVLRELIYKMAGIEPLPSLSEPQMAAMAGGPALRIEAIASTARGARLDPGDAVLKGPQRLGKGLLESSLALPLLIQVAQQRQACVYKAPNAHLKSLAGLYDATHGVLLQYLELLTSPSVVAPRDYADKVLPSLGELGQNYGICAPICMQIIRPVLHASLLTSALAMQEQERKANEEVEKRLKATLSAKREPGTSTSRVASPAMGNSVTLESSDPKPPADESEPQMEVDTVTSTTSQKDDSIWLPELAVLFDDVKKIAPGNAFDVIGPGFYLTFWQLSTYDLTPPSTKYDEESSKLKTLSRQEDSKYIAADRSADRSKRLSASSHRTRRDRYTTFVNVLANEFKEQTVFRAFTIKRLAREKQHWFSHATRFTPLVNSIIEHCIQPRCLLSPMDADFCAQFIRILHTQGTPGFHTLGCYDKLLGDHVKVVIFSCSEYEARNYGRFLLSILRELLNWHLDESAYIQDNRTKIGGKSVFHPGLQKSFSNNVNPDNILKWNGFQQVLRKWHRKLAKSFIDCIQTGEFMHVYNAIVVLKEILDVFPLASVVDAGSGIDAAMDRFVETEERGDLKILARSYSASLKRKEADWATPKLPSHLNGTMSPRPSQATSSPAPEKPRNGPVPTGPSAQQSTSSNDSRRNVPQPPSSAPSGPRAQLTSVTQSEKLINVTSTKLAMESIPRPEVVKRVRPDPKTDESVNDRRTPSVANEPRGDTLVTPRLDNDGSLRQQDQGSQQNGQYGKEQIDLPRHYRPGDDKNPRIDAIPAMPPPSAPSQTASAQELRETARQTIGRSEKPEIRSHNGSGAPSPRVRSPSPTSRPGTRNPSNESRTSGGKSRSDPGKSDRGSDDRRADRENRQEARETTGTVGRRDSLTHNRSERSTRERTSGRETDKERDSEREKERGRDRSDRDREKERDRDRDRDRDRHRRDEKDRDRDSRKDRDSASRNQVGPNATIAQDDRGLPTRPDPSRHRNATQNGDDGLGKRRRPADDDPERGSKRNSRKDGHREERGRRAPDKESHDRNRDSDRRRKDRETFDIEIRGASSDKPGDKKVPESSSSSKAAAAGPPSAPRADISRGKMEPMSGRDRHRDSHLSQTKISPGSGAAGPSSQPEPPRSLGSLRSRIGEQGPASPNTFRTEGSRNDDERESSRKRTVSDRDHDVNDPAPGPAGETTSQPPKRPRLHTRGRGHHGIAQRTLPIDRPLGDKNQRRAD